MMAAGGAAAPVAYLLDTNILIAYIRAGSLGRHVEATYSVMARVYKPLICEVTIGEMLAFAQRLGWGERKLAAMNKLLREVVRIDIGAQDVMEAYAEIDCFCVRSGCSLGKNDVWIAAATKAADAELLTTDKDFIPLFRNEIVRGVYIDPKAGRKRAD